MNINDWNGSWENFENYIDSKEADMVRTWEEAEVACQKHPALSKMFKNGCRAFWQSACTTVTEKNPKKIGGWEVHVTESGMEIEWFDRSQGSLGKAHYIIEGILEKGLEGKANTMLIAEDVPEDFAFRCILAMEPMPKRDAKNSGGLISHFHFQYGSDWSDLIADGKLKNMWWYATMCDKEATELQKCNIVRALHKMPAR